jgi:hypothetical protein
MRSLRLRVALGAVGAAARNPGLPASAGSAWSGGHGPAPGAPEPDEGWFEILSVSIERGSFRLNKAAKAKSHNTKRKPYLLTRSRQRHDADGPVRSVPVTSSPSSTRGVALDAVCGRARW